MTPTDILNAIAQALNDDTYKATRHPGNITIHVPTTGKTHTITYTPETTEIHIHPEGITYLDSFDPNHAPLPGQGITTINIADPNLFHKIHQHLTNTQERKAIPLPCGKAPTPPA